MATFTAKKIDELPEADALQDACVLPICQEGVTKKISGATLKTFIKTCVESLIGTSLGSVSDMLDDINGEVI